MSSEDLSRFPGGSRIFADARVDHDLVAAFFFAFSRAEYALKAAGWAKSGRYGEAQPDWDDFVANFGARILKDDEAGDLTGAVNYLEANPPQQQAWDGTSLSWRPRPARPNDTRSRILIDHVKTIRNNLFHGGKELRDHALAERDSALLNAGMAISLA